LKNRKWKKKEEREKNGTEFRSEKMRMLKERRNGI